MTGVPLLLSESFWNPTFGFSAPELLFPFGVPPLLPPQAVASTPHTARPAIAVTPRDRVCIDTLLLAESSPRPFDGPSGSPACRNGVRMARAPTNVGASQPQWERPTGREP